MLDRANEKLNCDCCGRDGVIVKRISRSFGRGDNLFVVDDIPLFACPHCGESYFSASTLQELERIKTHRHGAALRQAPVFEYG